MQEKFTYRVFSCRYIDDSARRPLQPATDQFYAIFAMNYSTHWVALLPGGFVISSVMAAENTLISLETELRRRRREFSFWGQLPRLALIPFRDEV